MISTMFQLSDVNILDAIDATRYDLATSLKNMQSQRLVPCRHAYPIPDAHDPKLLYNVLTLRLILASRHPLTPLHLFFSHILSLTPLNSIFTLLPILTPRMHNPLLQLPLDPPSKPPSNHFHLPPLALPPLHHRSLNFFPRSQQASCTSIRTNYSHPQTSA
jgi:hypothetical protein